MATAPDILALNQIKRSLENIADINVRRWVLNRFNNEYFGNDAVLDKEAMKGKTFAQTVQESLDTDTTPAEGSETTSESKTTGKEKTA